MQHNQMVMFIGEFGQVSSNQDKKENPYSYSPFLMWGRRERNLHTVYSDRLYSRDHKKFNNCAREVFGDEGHSFDTRDPKLTEAFLSKYYAETITLVFIEECCNVSTGYPYWLFGYKTKE